MTKKKKVEPAARPVSMERFGPVAIDYFNGRRVEKVIEGDNDAVWSIYFEGGGIIHNYDPLMPMPKTIIGAALTQVILGAHRDGQPVTEMRFGLEAVFLNPIEYSMIDTTYTKGQEVYAQRSDANMPTVAPYPYERDADGMTGPEEIDGT